MNSLEPAHLVFLRAVTLAHHRTRSVQIPMDGEYADVYVVSAARRWNAITAPIRRMAEDTGIPAHELLHTLDNV